MGCSNSTPAKNVPVPAAPPKTFVRNKTPLTPSEILQRLEAPEENQVMIHAGTKITFAWTSLRGYYPDALDKPNQDSYSIIRRFQHKDKSLDQAYFAVYDGHGTEGHKCAWYIRDNLPIALLDALEKEAVQYKGVKKAILAAHQETNIQIHTSANVDDILSGTTSISLLLRGLTMYVNNVGDSRAILLSCLGGDESRLTAKPLSSDQTPYRKDERDRLKTYGARILSMDQIEGKKPEHDNWGDLTLGDDIDETGDPPRIWSPLGKYPGTAFSRSFGDVIAEELGVIAEPEILTREIEPTDRYIVIASDGVFEFLTNQMVAEMVALRRGDPLAACKIIVSCAYELWLQYEVRTDDITIVILHLTGNEEAAKADAEIEANAAADAAKLSVIADGKNDETDTSNNLDDDDVKCHTPVLSPLMLQQQQTQKQTKQKSPQPTLTLTKSEQGLCIADMELAESRPVRREMSREKKKNVIIRGVGEEFIDEDDVDYHAEEKTKIHPKTEQEFEALNQALKSNFLFQHLSNVQRTSVINVMRPVVCHPGDRIIVQGDRGDKFYVVNTGRYEVRVQPVAGVDPTGGDVVHIYESNDHLHPGFGELSLMYGKPRAATVIALTDGILWSLDRRVFRSVVMRSSSASNRRDVIRALRKIPILKCLTLIQVQRLADLLSEVTFASGSSIVRAGDPQDTFYLIINGTCDCSHDGYVVHKKNFEYFGEKALSGSDISTQSVTAATEVKVMCINRAAFEEGLGNLTELAKEDSAKKAAVLSKSPGKLEGITLLGIVCSDTIGRLSLGAFTGQPPSLCVKSFILSQVDAAGLSASVLSFIEAARIVTSSPKVHPNPLLPRLHSICRDSNAIHLVFEQPVVADLSSFLRASCPDHTLLCGLEKVTYIAACVVSALETLHSLRIIYRSVQPEGIVVDSSGRVMLMDYRVSKIGGIGGRSFTICGATDYLAPEQLAHIGHGGAVDFWALGVLLYELAVGVHPFSLSSEMATYTRINSFGSDEYPQLVFPADLNPKLKSFISGLIVPTAAGRLGAGVSGFSGLKNNAIFEEVDWTRLSALDASPLLADAHIELEDLLQDGMSAAVVESFSAPYQGSGWDQKVHF